MHGSFLTLLAPVLAAATLSAGCLETRVESCAWGVICPVGHVCHEPTAECVPEAQVRACDGVADTKTCSFPGSSPDYLCRNGVCVEPYCGDGWEDHDEECDQGPDNSDEHRDTCRTSCLRPHCGDGVKDTGEECDAAGATPFCDSFCRVIVNVDLLIILDSSPSMAVVNSVVGQNPQMLLDELKGILGRLPNLHFGVTTTDLGTYGFAGTGCDPTSGDWGRLLPGVCDGLTGVNYAIDTEPLSCEVTRNPDGTCASHACTRDHCGHEPNTTLTLDEEGCPRCRNFPDSSLEDIISCLFLVQSDGCEYAQPLEAMYKALDQHPENIGFLREDAYLFVGIITDKDDCSASNPEFFDPERESELGPMTRFRCFEHGVTCNIDDRDHVGTRENCAPRADSTLIHPIGRYVDLLNRLKPPQMRMVAVFGGPSDGGEVTVTRDASDHPVVAPSCSEMVVSAQPGIRLKAFTEAVDSEEEQDWAFSSICDRDPRPILRGIAERMAADLGLD